jgi:hypothetical protein
MCASYSNEGRIKKGKGVYADDMRSGNLAEILRTRSYLFFLLFKWLLEREMVRIII